MRLVRFSVLLDHLHRVLQFKKEHSAILAGFFGEEVPALHLGIDELFRLKDAQEKARVRVPPLTHLLHNSVDDTVRSANGFAWTAKGRFLLKNEPALAATMPSTTHRRSFDRKIGYVAAIEGVLNDHLEIAGADVLRPKVQAVMKLREERNKAHLAALAATDALKVKMERSLQIATGWMEIYRGAAKIKDDTALLAKIPTLPRSRGHRKEATAETPPNASLGSSDRPLLNPGSEGK